MLKQTKVGVGGSPGFSPLPGGRRRVAVIPPPRALVPPGAIVPLLDRVDALPDDIKTLIAPFAYGVMYEAEECGDPQAFRIAGDVYTLDYDTWYIETWIPWGNGNSYDEVDGIPGVWELQIHTPVFGQFLERLNEIQADDDLPWRGGMCIKATEHPGNKRAIEHWRKTGVWCDFY